jgi:hypothetical protein
MHPYHIKEFTDERTASKLRSAGHHAAVAEARASQAEDGPCDEPVTRGLGFRIPLFRWEVRMQPTRPVRAGR